MAEERERLARYREERERERAALDRNAVIVVEDEVLDPRGRAGVGDNTASKNNKLGLANTAACPGRKPRGILFRLVHGFFDKDGFWCVPKFDGTVDVYRGANRETNARLTPDQMRRVQSARLAARRSGLR